jgi:hypothetical protein
MLKIASGVGLALGVTFATYAQAQDNATPAPAANAMAPASGAASNHSPLETAQKAPKGSLKNPYADEVKAGDQKLATEGHQLFRNYGCPGCHGVSGICPPTTNGVWIYGDPTTRCFVS